MKMWKSVVLAVALILSLFAATSSHAQSLQNGAVRGTVYDTSHSVVPGAKVDPQQSLHGVQPNAVRGRGRVLFVR